MNRRTGKRTTSDENSGLQSSVTAERAGEEPRQLDSRPTPPRPRRESAAARSSCSAERRRTANDASIARTSPGRTSTTRRSTRDAARLHRVVVTLQRRLVELRRLLRLPRREHFGLRSRRDAARSCPPPAPAAPPPDASCASRACPSPSRRADGTSALRRSPWRRSRREKPALSAVRRQPRPSCVASREPSASARNSPGTQVNCAPAVVTALMP